MPLSAPARDYYTRNFSRKSVEVSKRNNQSLEAIYHMIPGDQKNHALEEQLISCIVLWTELSVSCFSETCEAFGEIMDNIDVEGFRSDLSKTADDLLNHNLRHFHKLNIASTGLRGRLQAAIKDGLQYLEVEMVRLRRKAESSSKSIVIGSVTGGVQVGGSGNVQSISISPITQRSEAISHLRHLIHNDPCIPDFQKEDALDALDRLATLSDRDQTADVLERTKSKLEIVKSAIALGRDIAQIAAPYISFLFGALGPHSL